MCSSCIIYLRLTGKVLDLYPILSFLSQGERKASYGVLSVVMCYFVLGFFVLFGFVLPILGLER